MTYYDKAFRRSLLEPLTSYRKMLEQASVASSEQNYNILVNEKMSKVDEALKIVKPSTFDFLTERKIEKLQADEYLKERESEIQKEYEVKLELAKQELRESIKAELKREREKKKKRKREQAAMDMLPVLLKNMQTSGGDIQPDETALSDYGEVKNHEQGNDDFTDFPEPEFEGIE